MRAIEGFDLGRARVDPPHEALFTPYDHPVADADAALPEQNEAGDEIVGDRLQAEADADRQAAGDERELLDVEADLCAGEQDGDQRPDIAEDRADRVADARIEAGLRQKPGAEPVLDEPGREEGEDKDDRCR